MVCDEPGGAGQGRILHPRRWKISVLFALAPRSDRSVAARSTGLCAARSRVPTRVRSASPKQPRRSDMRFTLFSRVAVCVAAGGCGHAARTGSSRAVRHARVFAAVSGDMQRFERAMATVRGSAGGSEPCESHGLARVRGVLRRRARHLRKSLARRHRQPAQDAAAGVTDAETEWMGLHSQNLADYSGSYRLASGVACSCRTRNPPAGCTGQSSRADRIRSESRHKHGCAPAHPPVRASRCTAW